jgi:GxxExxY protein
LSGWQSFILTQRRGEKQKTKNIDSHKGTKKGKMNENEIGKIVVDAALTLHKELGPGLFELVYEVLMTHELQDRDLTIKRQVPVPIEYKGIKFDEGFRADIIIDDKVILELKSVENVTKAHKKQVLTYLRLTGCPPG